MPITASSTVALTSYEHCDMDQAGAQALVAFKRMGCHA